MDGRLSFDVYAEITDPEFRVFHEAFESRVCVTFGGRPKKSTPVNFLQLWFKEPDTVMALGRELVTAGMRLQSQLAPSRPSSSEAGSAEEYPVPRKVASDAEPYENDDKRVE